MTIATRRARIRARNNLRPFVLLAAAAALVFLAMMMVRASSHAGAHLAQGIVRPR